LNPVFLKREILENWLEENRRFRELLWTQLSELEESSPFRRALLEDLKQLKLDEDLILRRLRQGYYVLVEG